MATNPPTNERRVARPTRTEQAAINNLIERLSKQFPELPADEIRKAVCGEYEGFEASKVRDFVPILVERAARRELVHAGGHQHRA